MCQYGCISGAITLDVSVLLPMLSILLSTTTSISSSFNPKDSITNECGIDDIDFNIILIQLKYTGVTLLQSILNTMKMHLLKLAHPICRIINTIFTSREIREFHFYSGM
jgi:hypothetical protein